jgi:hypothetical protein
MSSITAYEHEVLSIFTCSVARGVTSPFSNIPVSQVSNVSRRELSANKFEGGIDFQFDNDEVPKIPPSSCSKRSV